MIVKLLDLSIDDLEPSDRIPQSSWSCPFLSVYMRSSTVIEFDFEAKMFLRRVLLGGGWRAMSTQVGKKVKETTGIVGLDVVPNAREVLISLYTRTLREIQAVPPDEGYRKAVESFTRQRLNVCLEEDDWEEIENRLGCGQVEELIEEAKDELTLISKMIEWDPWGVPEDYECKVIEDNTPIPKHVPHHRPSPLPNEFFKTLEAFTTDSPPKDETAPQLKT